MRYAIIALSILLGTATPAMAQVSVSVSIPGVTIGINQPVYPDLVLVPGYPVYYAPQAQTNYFFYDGLYWVYQDDRWYMSSWYNGPWDLVDPDDVPLFVLRVPVRYYVAPPVYFQGWVVSAPPRWELYWGPRWTRYHHGWDHWDRRVVYAPAPLPVYQRHYHGDRYPQREYQRVIRQEHYHYQPRDQVVRRHEQQRPALRPQADAQPGSQHRQAQQRPDSPREQRPQREREESRRSEPTQILPAQRAPVVQEQQRPQARRESERRAEPQIRPDAPRAQQAPREREESRRPESMQILPQQRAAVQQERQQQQQQQERQQQRQEAPRAQQAPRPQQAQDRGAQDRGDRQSRGNQERRQGQERGGDRGAGRG